MAGLPTFQSGLKGSELVNLDVFENFGPFWAYLDTFGPFQTKIRLWHQMVKKTFRLTILDPFLFVLLMRLLGHPVNMTFSTTKNSCIKDIRATTFLYPPKNTKSIYDENAGMSTEQRTIA